MEFERNFSVQRTIFRKNTGKNKEKEFVKTKITLFINFLWNVPRLLVKEVASFGVKTLATYRNTEHKMFAFGERVERNTIDFAAERARIKKGKAFTGRYSLPKLSQTRESFILPDITTTQLTQNCEKARSSWKNSEGMNPGNVKKTLQQVAKQGRLRDNAVVLEENGRKGMEDLEGLFVSKLNFQNNDRHDSPEFPQPLDHAKKLRKQRSRLSKTDSGFGDDLSDDVGAHFADSPNESDQPSNTSKESTSFPSPDHSASRVSPRERTRKITSDFKTILNREQTVVRNTDRLTARPHMCIQSQQSLHADLIAFRNYTAAHNGGSSNCTLQTNEHREKLREIVLKTNRNSYKGSDAPKQSDTSLAVLKTRRRLLRKRNSTGPPFPFTERRIHKECVVVDMRKAVCTCRSRRLHFSDFDRMDLNRQCVSCPADFRASQETVKLADHKNSPHFRSAVSTCSLTAQALLERSRSREDVDVKVKCQEWLNRWLASNGKTPNQQNLNEQI
ncbi:hypothetical protein AWC38_SpisGene15858 [Stylophora pistillata]|uniref:Uncharacterized protein n=1 Tax=Stylophora pistillata TaxID=50429 RepID=A0A2B4RQ25_STYPI|nr:hypothetical protein AWC38_SpisGene15858 [Stylophora pistillata]